MDDGSKYSRNAFILLAALALILFVLIVRLWMVQIIYHRSYLRVSKINAAQSMPLVAPRGIIYDRYGKVMVANRAVFSVYVLQTQMIDKAKIVRNLSRLLSMSEAEIINKLKEKRARPFDPILIKQNISKEMVGKISEQKHLLPGVVVNIRPVRVYPNNSIAAHVLGYIGEVTSDDLGRYAVLNIRQGDLIGKSGIEKIYDAYLRGTNGGERVSISTYGRAVEERGVQDPVPGKNVTLSIDLDLQKAVEDALGSNAGAVVVLDTVSGEVLAMASHPSYDPNIFSQPISSNIWGKVYRLNHPFLNRALSVYPPGSTFKVVTLSAVLEKGIYHAEDMFFCKGYFQLGRRIARCWKAGGHGHISLAEGLVQSCDVVFYTVGLKAGPDVIADFAKKYGLGGLTGIDLPSEASGIVPSSEWKKKMYKESWYPGDSINYAIGQGFLMVTPLQIANLYGLIANGRDRFEPHIALNIKDRDGMVLFSSKPKIIGQIPVSSSNLKIIKNALHDVVLRATGRAAKIPSFEAAGKTGTAENPNKPAHAWFVCYAPYDDPKIVVASFVEHGLHGDQVTARIANKVLTWYYQNRVAPEVPSAEAEDSSVIEL
ncbi:MAG: penicillin-binding protein 2 [Candidatus Margulisiibacteriota bacterium]